ncbi:amino acid permease, partial [Aspergillus arachidicola]
LALIYPRDSVDQISSAACSFEFFQEQRVLNMASYEMKNRVELGHSLGQDRDEQDLARLGKKSVLKAGFPRSSSDGAAILTFTKYQSEPYHVTLILWACVLVALAVNVIGGKLLPRLENLVFVLHIVGFLAILITLTYMAVHKSAKEVFPTWTNEGGRSSNGIVFFIGMQGSVFAFSGGDAAVHIMEKSTLAEDAIQPAGYNEYDAPPKDELQLNVGGRGATQRRLRNYHVTMIGFCSGIGTGLFVGTGAAYAKAGPAGLLLAYIVVGLVLWCVMQSIGELATLLPTAGSFPHWATRFIDPAVGFSLAISYGYCYTIAIASEVSAAAVIVSYWTDLTPAVVITVGLVLILASNLMSVRFYGETEVFGGAVKVLCFLGLVIVSIVITAGGANNDSIGFRYWNNPGPWTNYNGITGPTGHFLGFLSSFVNASFSFIGVETVVITAAESVNPHHAIPKAARRVTYRIAFFYILGALLIGIIVDPRNPALVSGSDNANSSPFVIAIKEAGINALPSIVNACILVAAWSAGNSYCWVGSRMILAMTTDHQLPQVFGRVTKKGVPYVAVITAWLFGPLAYLSLGSGGAAQAFSWLLNLSTVAGLIAWATLSFCYIRFHAAMKAQGVSRDTLPWKAPLQPYAAWVGFIGSTIIVLVAGFPVFLKGNWSSSDFVASYIGIPIFIVPIIGWKLFKRTKFARSAEIDLWSGRLQEGEILVQQRVPQNLWERFVDWLV